MLQDKPTVFPNDLMAVHSVPSPAIGVDLDGTIDEAPIFLKTLCKLWPGKVYVISWRGDRAKTEQDLAKFDIRYDELILVSCFADKAKVIVEKGILTYFDDQPEALQDIPPTVNVFLIRNGGNFDFEQKKWMMSDRTGTIK